MTSNGTTNGDAGKDRFRFSISDRIVPEVNKSGDVWSIFSPASGLVPKDSVNLGQGFMSFGPPSFLLSSLNDVSQHADANHYSIPRGRVRLRKALSKYISPTIGRQLNPDTEIIVTAGANEGMYSIATAFLRPGDEVILFEPYFDQYLAQVTFNQGKPVFVPIHAPKNANKTNVNANEWTIDMDELEAAITDKTKMIWINTPHNPIGKVFNEDELRAIGKIAEKHDLLIVSDEVYDCLTFDNQEHVRIAALDDFWKRTITVGSAGKSFAATGWRVGWLVGPADVLSAVLAATIRIVFCVNSPGQEAVGLALEQALENGFFEQQRQEYDERRKVLLEGLDKLGLPYSVPEGSYFVLVNTERLQIPDDFEVPDFIASRPLDFKAAWFVAQTAGVVSIPPTDFYSEGHTKLGESYLRFAFCKTPEMLRDASERLLKLKPYIRDP